MRSTAPAQTACAILILLALCLLGSALPCADFDADGACDVCEQDDLAPSLVLACPVAPVLLFQPGGRLLLAPAAAPAAAVPHPPII